MMNIQEQTLASIVTANHRAVPVLEKYHLDFCCKGKRTLSEACLDKGLSVQDIIDELQQPASSVSVNQSAFAAMNATELIGYILLIHHFYVKNSMTSISDHLEKVATKHGENFPYMRRVLSLFTEVKQEMEAHMQKEESILFPRIKELEAISANRNAGCMSDHFIMGPIEVMEAEHDHAGNILYEIRELTNNYTAPGQACTTFKVVLAELKEFEEDLHKHVHLENNILFPMAERMLAAIKN